MMKLSQFMNRLFKKGKEITVDMENSPFTDLTPVDNADPDGSYSRALSVALRNPRIKNIAVTGPYGSGKSSIIRTFEKNSDYKFLNISLASFKENKDESVNTTLIERSILQQMLYGADANKLPYSRFKRISTPELPLVKSLLLVIWVLSAIFLYQIRNELLNIESYSVLWFSGICLLSFVISLPVVLINDVHKASFGLSLKKFSLKNAEIETSDLSENSILNRHLDEIIYFFQVTNYDVVVIEDLDRFGDPDIFVKLREINNLINDNEKTRGVIKFLYALKDDMFEHKNRAKFFDFIIPVIPIINSSNSLDKMQEHLKKCKFAKSINMQFLREVSLYIDDFRLIHNIFNEFVIYYEQLKSSHLDVTKLLAMMIYKNVYPNDFESLHYGKGVLFEICKNKSIYLQKSKRHMEMQLNNLKLLLGRVNSEKARSVQELIDAYIGHIMLDAQANQPAYGIFCGNQYVGFSQFTTFEKFKPLLSEKNIKIAKHPSYHPNHGIPINKSFSQLEEEINPGETFLSRKESIENCPETKQIELRDKTHRIEKELYKLSHVQLSKIIQNNDIQLDDLIKSEEIEDSRLLLYLVRNGYLDDNYHLYTSNFHEGRLTKNDRDYLLAIRNFNQPDPNQKIDTPQEVCANMREEDFGHKYVLNVTLVDYLLENNKVNSRRINSAMHYISQNFEQSEEFFTAYFITGKHLDKFICSLSREWPRYASTAISSRYGAEHISYILKFVETEYVSENMNIDKQLTAYLSEQGQFVLASDFQFPDDYNVLKKLNVRFHDLVTLEQNENLLKYSRDECLYAINSRNVNHVLHDLSETQNKVTIRPENANYTSIQKSESDSLRKYIENNLPEYIENVFLALPENSDEGELEIKKLINKEIISHTLREKIISKQSHIFNNFEGIPETLWSFLLLEDKVIITWKNISEYFDVFEGKIVTKILERQSTVDSLSKSNISTIELGDNNSASLSSFILHNDEIKDTNYAKLIKCLPYWYKTFPTDVSPEKINILAKERKVRLTEDTFSFSSDDDQLMSILISENVKEYLKDKDEYPISDGVRELLLLSEISEENKVIICLDVTPSGAKESRSLSKLIANLLLTNNVDYSNFDNLVLKSAIVNTQNITDSINLLVKCLSDWDEKMTMDVLAELPEPFNEISSYGKRPKIDNNTINLEFARLLETKGFISSVKEKYGSIKIHTFKSSDHSE